MRSLFLFVILIVSISLQAQVKDTSLLSPSSDKEPFYKSMFVRCMPFGIYTGAGYLQDRVTQNIELGKSFGMIDAGLCYGVNALREDSLGNGRHYLEGRITMDLCQFEFFPMK